MGNRADRLLGRREFLAATGSGLAVSSGPASIIDGMLSQVETEKPLPKVEAEYIALKAKQRRQLYLNYAQLFSTSQKIQNIAGEVLPNHEDLIVAAFPGSTLVSAYDLHSTINSVRQADRLVSIKATLEMGIISNVRELDEPDDAASQARNENNRLASKAKQVTRAAEDFINGNATVSDVESALQAELNQASESSVGTIIEWTGIDPEFYDDVSRFETSDEAAEYVLEVAESNLDTVKQARKQLEKQIQSVSSKDTDFLVDASAQMINANREKLPELAKTLFGSERMNVHVSMPSGAEIVVFLRTENAKVVESHAGKGENARIKVMMDSETLREIIGSETPGKEFEQAILNDDIRYKGLTPVTWAVTGVVSTLENVFGELF